MFTTRFCQTCDEELVIHPDDREIKCRNCMAIYRVDPDAEFVNGSWRDLTQLIPIEEGCAHHYREMLGGVKCIKCDHFVGNWE
jgi:hypothetical protein